MDIDYNKLQPMAKNQAKNFIRGLKIKKAQKKIAERKIVEKKKVEVNKKKRQKEHNRKLAEARRFKLVKPVKNKETIAFEEDMDRFFPEERK